MSVKNKSIRPWRWIISIILVIAIILGAAGGYFFHVAEVRSHKDFIKGGAIKAGEPLYQKQEAWKAFDKQTWKLTAHDGTNLQGYYVKAEQPTTKTALVIHGFGVDHQAMTPYATMFHEQGYNVLLIDNRAAGKSGGKYIGYGFLEAQDVKQWTQKIVQKNGDDTQIVVMGASLGGATTMMLSGMNPPKQVKAYVEDAGYNSISEELLFQANAMYHLPKWLANPLVKIVSLYSKIFAGYSFKQGEVSQYLAKNERPMMFIHGSDDTFVPTKFVYENYHAQKGPKELLVVPHAEHVKSYAELTNKYEQKVEKFLSDYIK